MYIHLCVAEACLKAHDGSKIKDIEDGIVEFLKQCPFKPGGAKYKVRAIPFKSMEGVGVDRKIIKYVAVVVSLSFKFFQSTPSLLLNRLGYSKDRVGYTK